MLIQNILTNIIPKKTNINFTSNNYNLKSSLENDKLELCYDIGYKAEYPINILSNFTKCSFMLDNIQINSIEGFLQSLKTPDIEKQKKICLEHGTKAKGFGKKLNKQRNYDFKHFYWNGKKYNRDSQEYQDLLKRAYEARYQSDEEFRFALEYTNDRILKHSLGGKDPKRCMLTEQEFINILTDLRNNN